MDNPKEIQRLVRQITKARTIHKSRVEGEQISMQQDEENIAKLQKPVVEAVQKQAKETVNAIQQQQLQLARLNNAMPTKHPLSLTHEDQEDILEDDEDEQGNQEKWIQKFYKDYKSPRTAITKLEANLNGEIGDFGHMDMVSLFNKGIIQIHFKGQPLEIKEALTTPGLLALLLLPMKDMLRSKIKPNEEDILHYRAIMTKAGFQSSKNNLKYKRYLKKDISAADLNETMDNLDNSMEEYETTDSDKSAQKTPQKSAQKTREKSPDKFTTPTSSPKVVSTAPKVVAPKVISKAPKTSSNVVKKPLLVSSKLGKGVFAYKNPKEIESRLEVLFGSLKAGNNSRSIKDEIRSLLDELLELKQVLPHIHRKLYQSYNL